MQGHKQINNNNQENSKNVISQNTTVQQQIIQNKGQLSKFIKDEKLINILNKKGIKSLLPIQYSSFDYIYNGEDVVAKDRTGSGKTIAFSLPTILRLRQMGKFKGPRQTRFLIVVPTRQLALQVKDQIYSIAYKQRNDYNVVAVYGGANMQDQIRNLSRGADIIVGTPGRLIDFMQNGHIRLQGLQVICLDEADQMLNIGFKQDIQKIFKNIYNSIDPSKYVQCLMFSATIPEWVWDISDRYQSQNVKFVDMLKDGFTKTSKTVEHYSLQSTASMKQFYIGSIIDHFFKEKQEKQGKQAKQGKIIIFCQTKKQVEKIGYSGSIPFHVQMLHGDFKQQQRERVFRKFKSGQAACLVATNVAARGLDFPQIDLVIQMQPPNTTDSYIHRSGRTGRAGKTGFSVTLFCQKQQHLITMIQKQAKIKFIPINTQQVKPCQKPVQKDIGVWKMQGQNQNNNNFDKSNSSKGGFRNNNFKQKGSYNSYNSFTDSDKGGSWIRGGNLRQQNTKTNYKGSYQQKPSYNGRSINSNANNTTTNQTKKPQIDFETKLSKYFNSSLQKTE